MPRGAGPHRRGSGGSFRGSASSEGAQHPAKRRFQLQKPPGSGWEFAPGCPAGFLFAGDPCPSANSDRTGPEGGGSAATGGPCERLLLLRKALVPVTGGLFPLGRAGNIPLLTHTVTSSITGYARRSPTHVAFPSALVHVRAENVKSRRHGAAVALLPPQSPLHREQTLPGHDRPGTRQLLRHSPVPPGSSRALQWEHQRACPHRCSSAPSAPRSLPQTFPASPNLCPLCSLLAPSTHAYQSNPSFPPNS